MVSIVESGIRQETPLPELRREGLRRVLAELIEGDYEEITFQRLRKLKFLSPDERLELNPSLETRQDAKIINLFSGVLKGDRVSLDIIFPRSKIERPSQIVSRNSQGIPLRDFDVPSIYHLFAGRMGVYTEENYEREEILHDQGWEFSIVSGRRPHRIFTWEKSAFLLTTVPDTAYVSSNQINLPL